MRINTTLLLAAGILATAVPAIANTVVPPGSHLVPGLYDPKTGTFKPMVTPSLTGASPDAGVTNAGKFYVVFNITVGSVIPTNAPIYCQVEASTSDPNNVFIDEQATALATRKTATSASCAVTIAYSWKNLSQPTHDPVSLVYTLTAGAVSSTNFNYLRTSAQPIATLTAIPVTGKTTDEVVTATL